MVTHKQTYHRLQVVHLCRGRVSLARSDIAGNTMNHTLLSRSVILRPPREDIASMVYRWRTKPVTNHWRTLSVSERSSLARSDTASNTITNPSRSIVLRPPREDIVHRWFVKRLRIVRRRSLPIREGPFTVIVWKIIGVVQGSSPEGTSPPIRSDATRYVMRKTQGSSVPL